MATPREVQLVLRRRKIFLPIAWTLFVISIGALLLAIWVWDERWLYTGFLLLFVTAVIAGNIPDPQ